MTTGAQFSADVSAWVRATEARMLAVFKESVQRTVSLAQDGIPVDTGFARASIRSSLTEMPQIDPAGRPKKGESFGGDSSGISATIAGVELGGTVFVGWTASYVPYLEYGSSQQAPQGFIRIAAMQWQRIVEEVSAEAKGRAGG